MYPAGQDSGTKGIAETPVANSTHTHTHTQIDRHKTHATFQMNDSMCIYIIGLQSTVYNYIHMPKHLKVQRTHRACSIHLNICACEDKLILACHIHTTQTQMSWFWHQCSTSKSICMMFVVYTVILVHDMQEDSTRQQEGRTSSKGNGNKWQKTREHGTETGPQPDSRVWIKYDHNDDIKTSRI